MSSDLSQNVAEDLAILADQLAGTDDNAAKQIANLGESLAARDLTAWLGIDLFQMFVLDNLEERVASRHFRFRRAVRWLEVVRNFLVLLPLTLTWLSLWAAAVNYRAVVSPPHAPSQESFLLLWERGFDGLGPIQLPLVHTFSQLALWDAVLLIGLIVITITLYGWRTYEESRTFRLADVFRRDAERVLGRANVLLAQERYARTEKASDQFRIHAEQLVRHLESERVRADELVVRREQEVTQLTIFASDLVKGTQDLPSFARQIHDVYQAFAGVAGQFNTRADQIGAHVHQLTNAVSTANDRLLSLTQSYQATQAELQGAIDSLRRATEQSTKNVASAADAAEKTIQLASGLATLQNSWQRALVEDRSTYQAIVQNLQSTSGNVESVIQRFNSALERIDGIAKNINVVMHLSAQLADDYHQRDEQEHQLQQALGGIADNLHIAVEQLSEQHERIIDLQNRSADESQRLTETWSKGYDKWIEQIEFAAKRVAGVLVAQGTEIQRSTALMQNGWERLTAEYANARSFTTQQGQLLTSQLTSHSTSMEHASQALISSTHGLIRYYEQLNNLADKLIHSPDGRSAHLSAEAYPPGDPTVHSVPSSGP